MRQIKFRYPVFDAHRNFIRFHYWGYGVGPGNFQGPALFGGENVSQQYTGLKDKNGQEIYEGDIVNISYMTSGVKGYIRYSKSKTAFILCDENKRAVTTLGSMTLEKDRFNYPKTIQIIGNIYKTPELLER